MRNGHPDQAVCSSLRPGALAGLLAMDAAHSVGARGAAHHVADHAKDDQAFRQLWISWQTRHAGQLNKRLWGSVASLAPTDYKRKER